MSAVLCRRNLSFDVVGEFTVPVVLAVLGSRSSSTKSRGYLQSAGAVLEAGDTEANRTEKSPSSWSLASCEERMTT